MARLSEPAAKCLEAPGSQTMRPTETMGLFVASGPPEDVHCSDSNCPQDREKSTGGGRLGTGALLRTLSLGHYHKNFRCLFLYR